MKIKMEILKSVFDDHLRDFELADAIYMAAEREFIDFDLDHGTSEEMKAVREKLHSACADREFYAVVLCKYLLSCKDLICFEADPVDAPEDVPEDAPEDAPADVPENAPEDSPADIFPVMSAKCNLCPSCVDGRCFFVPDVYDSIFPCLSPAWDDFFKNVGSHGPAP